MLRAKRSLVVTLFAVLAATAVYATSTPEDEARLRETRSCPGCDLTDAELSGVVVELGDVSYANFSGAKLYGAIFKGADLTGANFNGADLTAAQLQTSKGADLTGAITDWRTQCPNGQPGPCN
jgi:uncharacterized protein YjbI with pentapeptide repeats